MTDPSPLKGARIWIAGARPDGLDAAAASRFDAFVARLSALIFQCGGSIVHGSHPTVRCTLLNAATEFQEGAEGPRDCLMLAASRAGRRTASCMRTRRTRKATRSKGRPQA